MPLATNPKRTLAVWLDGDADRPEAERPTFRCRFLTRHEINVVADELGQVQKLTDVDEMHRRLTAVLAGAIVGWEHMTEPGGPAGPVPVDYAAERFDRVLTPPEKWELAFKVLSAPRMTENDAKKSPSSATSTPGSSAPGAGEGSATSENSTTGS